MHKSKEQLIIENEELQSRLGELESTLMAIRSGEVDAIVVSGDKGEQVYSINSAETPYRTFIEEMNEGAVTLTKDGIILYCNQKFAEFVNEPLEDAIGAYFNRFVAPEDKPSFENLLTQMLQHTNDELTISLTNGLHLKLSLHLLPPYLLGDCYILIATDISELKRKENELLDLQRLLEQQLDQSRGLRIDLVNARLEAKAENNQLMKTNEKLVGEIARLKLGKRE
ncbi:MAG: PAS domain-containing protein [Lentimicrobium sp.]|nr:PAS domain-containing protein [Lentimicrobium sp.]